MQTETSSKVAATRVMEGKRGSGSALEWFSVAHSPRTVSCFSVRGTRCLKFSSSVASELQYNLSYSSALTLVEGLAYLARCLEG